MRSFLTLGFLITLCASANASTVHPSHTQHLAFVPPGMASNIAGGPGWAYPPTHYNDTPSYDDPSRYGGGALPVH
jgi:hypothetical protein